MVDIAQIMEMLRVEPGHGLIQSLLLLMIWWSSRGVEKKISAMQISFDDKKVKDEVRFENIEGRLNVLETKEN